MSAEVLRERWSVDDLAGFWRAGGEGPVGSARLPQRGVGKLNNVREAIATAGIPAFR